MFARHHWPGPRRAERECTGALAFLRGGIDTLIRQHGITDARLRQAADRAAQAFADFERYLQTELRQHPTDTLACGAEAFDLLLRQGHFLDRDAAAIEAAAQAEFTASAAYLAEHARDFGAATWQEAIGGPCRPASYRPSSTTHALAKCGMPAERRHSSMIS